MAAILAIVGRRRPRNSRRAAPAPAHSPAPASSSTSNIRTRASFLTLSLARKAKPKLNRHGSVWVGVRWSRPSSSHIAGDGQCPMIDNQKTKPHTSRARFGRRTLCLAPPCWPIGGGVGAVAMHAKPARPSRWRRRRPVAIRSLAVRQHRHHQAAGWPRCIGNKFIVAGCERPGADRDGPRRR
jgi:hypothetical protein